MWGGINDVSGADANGGNKKRKKHLRYLKTPRRSNIAHEGGSLTFGPFVPAFFFNQACARRSPADGRISWSSSKHRSKKLWASVEMSEGIGGFALKEPIYKHETYVRHQ
jgi:hypothetical protein